MTADKVLDAFFKSFSETESSLDFRMGHETVGEKLPLISTGSFVLDDVLGSGGIPKGRLIQFYGAAGSGKTMLAMLAMKEAQKQDPESRQMFIDSEGTFDPNWAEILGVDTSRIILVEGETAVYGRNCFEMLLGVPKEDKKTHHLVGKSKDGLLDKIIKKELNINLIILDSLGSIIPPGEDISAVGKMNISLLARFLTTTLRKLSLELKKANVPMILINHKKATLDPYGADHTFSGGNTYVHFLSANLYFEQVSRKDAQVLDENEAKRGATIRATVEKSKFGIWPKKCEFKVDFSIGMIDQHEEVGTLALDYGVVQKPTNVSHVFGDQKWVGAEKFFTAIKDDPSLFQKLVEEINLARDKKMEEKRNAQKNRTSEKTGFVKFGEESSEETVEEENSESEEAPKKRGRKAKGSEE